MLKDDIAKNALVIIIPLIVVVALTTFYFLRQEQRYRTVLEDVESLKTNKDITLVGLSEGGTTSSQETDNFPSVEAVINLDVKKQGEDNFLISWPSNITVQRIKIFDAGVDGSREELILDIQGDSLPAPYVVGSVPGGFVVKEGTAFDAVDPLRFYKLELYGREGEKSAVGVASLSLKDRSNNNL